MFGHLSGHLTPGFFFLSIGSWWAINILPWAVPQANGNSRKTYHSFTWFSFGKSTRPIEPLLRVIMCLTGMVFELMSCKLTILTHDTRPYAPVFRMDSVSNLAHCTMYSFFALHAMSEILTYYNYVTSRSFFSHFTLSFAFFVEGILFFFHLDGHRSTLNVNAHILLYWLCFTISLVILLECKYPCCYQLGILRFSLLLVQGTWFIQIAFSVYGEHKWSQTATSDAMLIPIVFTWHCFGWLLVLVVGLLLLQRRRYLKNAENEYERLDIGEHFLLQSDDNELEK